MTTRLRWPSRQDWAVLAFGAFAWIGVGAGGLPSDPGPLIAAGVVGVALAVASVAGRVEDRTAAALGVALVLGVVSGAAARTADAAIAAASTPTGPIDALATLRTDPEPGRYETWALAVVRDGVSGARLGPTALIAGAIDPQLAVGDTIRIRGLAVDRSGRAGGDLFGWRVMVRSSQPVSSASGLLRVSNGLRERVAAALDGYGDDPAAGLVAGFLIGDERGIPEVDRDAMRAAGLSHFTAVSGSNVALFLGGLWLALGPLGMGRRRRAVLGIVGLVVFAGMTRWEPSVLRACVMAGALLTARAAGLALSPWMALGAATGVLVLADAHLVSEPGFHLSVAAAGGVILAAGAWRRRFIGPALSAAIGAHVAVAPVLLLHFGAVPEWGPLLNLVAAPLVAFATTIGAVGALAGVGLATRLAVDAASVVLAVARVGSNLPPLGWMGPVILVAVVGALRMRRLRLPALVLVLAVGLTVSHPPEGLPPGAVVFLDVGQGDAAVMRTPEGRVILVDGGPDPVTLDRALRRWAVDEIDLVIISHSHRDHVAGLEAVFGRRRVGTLWHSDSPDPSGHLEDALAAAETAGVTIVVPAPGASASWGAARLEVVAPVRRYASPNDQSLVVIVGMHGRTVAFTGDIETHAQADLAPVRADVLKVPHQGAATSDLAWLAAAAPELAVVSVGPNNYGHPDADVLAALEAAGARVIRTDEHGDLLVRLDR